MIWLVGILCLTILVPHSFSCFYKSFELNDKNKFGLQRILISIRYTTRQHDGKGTLSCSFPYEEYINCVGFPNAPFVLTFHGENGDTLTGNVKVDFNKYFTFKQTSEISESPEELLVTHGMSSTKILAENIYAIYTLEIDDLYPGVYTCKLSETQRWSLTTLTENITVLPPDSAIPQTTFIDRLPGLEHERILRCSATGGLYINSFSNSRALIYYNY